MTLVSSDDEDINKQKYEKPNIKGDKLNILLLIIVYLLQNIVSGLANTLPLVMQNRGVSYADQAEFTFVSYPGCMKLLWAPIVDCVYVKKFGRRKSWVIPMQYIMGIILLLTSINLENWLGSDGGARKPRIRLLTIVFFINSLFTAVQDVALDAWSLTMLQRRNVGYAGTCQSVGGAIGQFISLVLFIVLDSKDFCNMFRSTPKDYGFYSLAESLFFWSIVIMIATTFVLIFKKDNSLDVIDDDFDCRLGLKESYVHLWRVLKVKPIQLLSLILLTHKVGFAPLNGVAGLKLIDVGIRRDNFVLLTIPALPFQLLLSVILSRHIAGPRSMRAFCVFYVMELVIGLALAFALFLESFAKGETEILPIWYYCLLVFLYNTRTVVKYLMGIAAGAFFLRVSDPKFGGIYLTLLNTMGNIGHHWPSTLCLWAVNKLSINYCTYVEEDMTTECHTIFDGYFSETLLCTAIGVLWLCWGQKVIKKLEKTDCSLWIPQQEQQARTNKDELLLT